LSAKPVHYLSEKLKEAELLLAYAVEVGIEVEETVRGSILTARTESDGAGLTRPAADNLLIALTTLAAKVRPVTVASLIACHDPKKPRAEIRFYGIIAGIIGLVILLFSLCTFASSRVSDQIGKDIETANNLAAKLRTELGPSPPAGNPSPDAPIGTNVTMDVVWYGTNGIPPGLSDKDVITDLQQFAATMREIQGYAGLLKYFLLSFDQGAYNASLTNNPGLTNQAPGRRALELTPGLNVRLAQELTDRAEEYQIVRGLRMVSAKK
jgi:hypothetical protein